MAKKETAQSTLLLQQSSTDASDLLMRLSESHQSMGKSISANLQMLDQDGKIRKLVDDQQIQQQSPGGKDNRIQQQKPETEAKRRDNFDDEFGYLVFNSQEMANSFDADSKASTAMKVPAGENAQEKAQRFQIQLSQVKLMAQAQLQEQ